MARCRITVLKCTFDRELKEQYIPDPDYGLCPYFQPGQVFWYDGGEDRPEGFGCRVGWKSIRDEAAGMTRPQPAFLEGRPHVVCCNDGCRPVIFLLEHVAD